MKAIKSAYNPNVQFNGLTHDRLSRSAWRLAGLDPVQRQRDAQDRIAARFVARARARAITTAALALAWLGLVWLAIR